MPYWPTPSRSLNDALTAMALTTHDREALTMRDSNSSDAQSRVVVRL